MRLIVFAFVVVATAASSSTTAQERVRADERAARDGDVAASLMAARAVLDSLVRARADVAARQAAAAAAIDEAQKLAALAEAERARAELAKLEGTLDSVATGIDLGAEEGSDAQFDVVREIEKLLQPLIEELKDITAEPRQVSQLRNELQRETARQSVLQRGAARARRLREATTDEALRGALSAVAERWQRDAQDARNRQTIVRHRLDEADRQRRSVYESARSFLGRFFRATWLNLAMAFGAGVAVFALLRWLYRQAVRRLTPGRQTPFSLRAAAVFYHLFVVIAAVGAGLAVLYVASDWVLLGLALLVLFGLAWAGKQTVPRFLEQIRLALNLGSMREGERVLFQGLPWRVERIRFDVQLVNPALAGELRLPLSVFVGQHSRPCLPDEPWFPSRVGDWVVLGDVRGRVVQQTPEFVQIATPGGSAVTYTAAAYLGASPTNLAHGFRVRTTFGIDYRHQPIATTEVPAVMRARVLRELTALVGADNVVAVGVEFASASPSSLDYLAFADLRGAAAPLAEPATRILQRALVDVCNERGWNIPLPQLTVHQAPA